MASRYPAIGRLLLGAVALLVAAGAAAQAPFVVVASTTSTEQSGLFRHLLPAFTRSSGIEVRVVAQGTGQALDTARRGDADVVLVHDPEAERRFVAEGWARSRHDVMYNDFVIVGPAGDPAKVAGLTDALVAMRRIRDAQAPFVSRGDRSGTHAAELRLWREAGVEIERARAPWYRETGSGMGPALNTAAGLGAYVLTDRGTWLSFRNRGDMRLLVAGDRRLHNPYGVMLVDPARHPHVRHEAGRRLVDWLLSPEGQRAIASYRIDGEQLFFPNAGG
ncbi:MAG TPA: substrate-binding domain-containing protein [Burkholderiaceae bacterium]|nr:substrate-binding domain-containing protein [Burkholderiaceae bacterium]